MREQIYKISNLVINGKYLFLQAIANISHKKKGTIASHIERAKREISQGGVNLINRPPILDSYIMSSLRQKVCEDYENHILCTYSSLAKWLYDTYNINISYNTLETIIRKDQMVKPILGKSMEIEKLDASPEDIDSYSEESTSMIVDPPADLVANFDEMGYAEYSDLNSMKIVIPEWAEEGSIPIKEK
ncbi:hypothetical protein GPJ56_009281 [Histomonas meleagridis]|uniref:uncharacterized protein n=1 Tax=Histomonas meleagridis TaxID=135588 RepID=UPI00355AC18D|nr:hypothetical protein GPJ56_009281 [Histomonas meleagridis]KAH0797694.1 hypothetical protein GO595_009323 [Histomonas meleagridis]